MNSFLFEEINVHFPDDFLEMRNVFDNLLSDRNSKYISFINPEIMMQQQKDNLLHDYFVNSRFNFIDGVGLLYAINKKLNMNYSVKNRFPGTDFFEYLPKKEIKVFLYGSKPGIPELAKQRIEKKYAQDNHHLDITSNLVLRPSRLYALQHRLLYLRAVCRWQQRVAGRHTHHHRYGHRFSIAQQSQQRECLQPPHEHGHAGRHPGAPHYGRRLQPLRHDAGGEDQRSPFRIARLSHPHVPYHHPCALHTQFHRFHCSHQPSSELCQCRKHTDSFLSFGLAC